MNEMHSKRRKAIKAANSINIENCQKIIVTGGWDSQIEKNTFTECISSNSQGETEVEFIDPLTNTVK